MPPSRRVETSSPPHLGRARRGADVLACTVWALVEQAAEQQVVIKTLRAHVPALLKRLSELHPYELPEVLVIEADAVSEPYAAWVRESTGAS